MLHVGWDAIGVANVPDDQTCKGLFLTRTEPTRVERPCNLSIRLFGGQNADEFDDVGRGTNQIRRAQRQCPFYRCRSPGFPAEVDLDFLILHQCDVFDKES
jgi:hypothetical protein